MRAVTFQSIGTVAVETVPDPVLVHPSDAIVRIERTAICGSDLHVVRGREQGIDAGTVLGHELVGVVAEAGSDSHFAVGTRVVSAFSTSCGTCVPCSDGWTSRCERGELFGWVENGHGLQGAQAEYVRIPLADGSLVAVPDGLDPELALWTGDVLSTGFFCAEWGGVKPGASVAVLGCGPVGLCAILAARSLGAERIFALDAVPERLEQARSFGAQAYDCRDTSAVPAIVDALDGRGVDVVLEVVGLPDATRSAYELVRSGGTISAVGVHTEAALAFSPGEAYDKNLTYRAGRCPARAYMERLLPWTREHAAELGGLVTHRRPLDEAVDAYRVFDGRLEGCIKTLLVP